jgi:hypothetical protein
MLLKSLQLRSTFSGDMDLSASSFHPLRRLAALTEIQFRSYSPQYDLTQFLGDRDVESMALGWPALEVFSLSSAFWQEHPPDFTPGLSLHALGLLCAHCPKLRSVSLSMNTDPIPTAPAQLPCPNSRPLESLDFGHSAIKDPYAIAKWFGDACVPHGITFRKHTLIEHDPRNASWEQVSRVVALLQEARREGAREVEVRDKAANGGRLGRCSDC